MIPKSLSPQFAAGKITLQQVQATQPPRPKVVYTPEGQKAADSFNRLSPKDNPWFACKPTSFIRDWTADWPINRFEQKTLSGGEKVIDITYGLYNFERRIHVGMAKHPDESQAELCRSLDRPLGRQYAGSRHRGVCSGRAVAAHAQQREDAHRRALHVRSAEVFAAA